MKRVILFIATNLAIIFLLSITMRLLGVEELLATTGSGFNLNGALIFAAIFGFGGAFISLLISKWSALRMTGAEVIKEPHNRTEAWLLNVVSLQAEKAGIEMPDVAIYSGDEMNAFATGWNRDNALVAVSSGLLEQMQDREIEAVLAHEISHVANGDMVTMALIQGVVNTFVIFLSRVIGHLVDRIIFKTERGYGPAYWITSIVAELVLGVFASMIVFWFSRQREYRADAGAAKLSSRNNMIRALQRLGGGRAGELPAQLAAFGIRGKKGVMDLFRTHPSLLERIERLKQEE